MRSDSEALGVRTPACESWGHKSVRDKHLQTHTLSIRCVFMKPNSPSPVCVSPPCSPTSLLSPNCCRRVGADGTQLSSSLEQQPHSHRSPARVWRTTQPSPPRRLRSLQSGDRALACSLLCVSGCWLFLFTVCGAAVLRRAQLLSPVFLFLTKQLSQQVGH